MSDQYVAGYGSSPTSPARTTDTLAILGLVFGIVFWPAGLVLSILGLKRTKRDGTNGHGLALAGLIISIVFGLLAIVSGVLLFAAASSSVSP